MNLLKNRSTSKHLDLMKVFIGVVFVFVVIGMSVGIYSQTVTTTYAECVVTGKDRTTSSEGGSTMRVYTENCGTFSAGDSLLDFKFNSADIYGSLKEGETYTFETRGIRVPLLSMFPNIISAN